VIAVAPAVKNELRFIASLSPSTAIVFAEIEEFVVGPPEQLGVAPDVTRAGCVIVFEQSKKPSAEFEYPAGIAILTTRVL
jgi:hypothetical protein